MRSLSSTLALLALVAGPAFAQEQPAPAEAPAIPGMSMGETVAPDGGQIGSPYLKSEHGEWDIRCIRTESGQDPCQLYQLLEDADGNSVAEFSLFPLQPAQGPAIAGGNFVTPLETLLPEQVTLVVDGGAAKRYPFTFCTEIGCFARVGFTAEDIDQFKRGRGATVSIVPIVAPDQRITLELSLSGFTAGYDALDALIKEQAAAGGQ